MKTRAISVLVLAFLMTFSSNIFAQRGQGKGYGRGGGICNHIPNLTDAQKEKITKFRTAHQKEMLQFRNQMQEKKAQLQTLSTADNPNINSINSKIDEIGTVKVKMMKQRESFRQSVRKELNEEQRVAFDTHFCNRKGKHGRKGRGHGHRQGKGQGCGNGNGWKN